MAFEKDVIMPMSTTNGDMDWVVDKLQKCKYMGAFISLFIVVMLVYMPFFVAEERPKNKEEWNVKGKQFLHPIF